MRLSGCWMLALLLLAACGSPRAPAKPADTTTTITVDSAPPPVQGGVIRATVLRPKIAGDTVARLDTLSRADSAWVRKSGDTTRYGHSRITVFRQTFTITDSVLLPQVLTPRPLDFGQSQVPDTVLGAGVFTANMGGADPIEVPVDLRASALKRTCLFILPRRKDLSATGKAGGLFSVDSAKAWADKILALGFTADSFAAYQDALCGINIADDYGDKDAWGQKVVTNQQVDSVRSYYRQRFGPTVALGIRIGAPWITFKPLQDSVSYVWAQYREKFDPDYKRWLTGQIASANAIGAKIVGAVNVSDCGPTTGGGPCKPEKLLAYYSYMIQNPAFCAVMGYAYDPRDVGAKKAVYDSLSVLVKKTPRRSCKR